MKFIKLNNLRKISCFVSFSAGLNSLKNLFKNRPLVSAAIIAVVSTAAIAAVFTPPIGIITAPIVARAVFTDPTDIKIKIKGQSAEEVINIKDARETVMQQIILAPGGNTGWHSHPGPVIVLVKSGKLTFYDGDDPTCAGRTYKAGDAFIDSGQGHVHIARNEQAENLELWATYLDVPPGSPVRIDVPNPGNCAF